MYVHVGANKDYIWHYGTRKARAADKNEREQLWRAAEAEFERNNGSLIYSHKVSIFHSKYKIITSPDQYKC